jgi:SAM-dependent methyltransferase
MRRPTIGADLQHPSSFRDPDSVVYVREAAVHRLFGSVEACDECLRALKAPFAESAVADGRMLAATPIPMDDLPAEIVGGLASERTPFVTDPREWSFEMRKDAALLTLELSGGALGDGFEMKDASAYIVLFDGCNPRFVDHGSFRETFSGHWPGYGQFGDHFMNPLLVEANAGVAASSLNFGIDGLGLDVAAAALRGTGRFKKGSMSWIWRRGVAKRMSGRVDPDAGDQLSAARLPREAVAGLIEKAHTSVEALESDAPSFWRDYEGKACPYDETESKHKRELVAEWARLVETRAVALDVGCNVGTFAETLAAEFDRVIAVDNDSVAIDVLYRRACGEKWGTGVTPVVVDLAQPTPAIGWRNRERASFLDRLGVVDLSVWLAVLHHLILTGGIPLEEILRLMAATSRFAIVEHIAPEDGFVRTMTAGRRWASVPDLDAFHAALDAAGFTVLRSEATAATRTLFLVRCPG